MKTLVPSGQLQKRLGVPSGIAVCVGLVVGTGIMRAPGEIANTVPDSTIVMVLWLAGGCYGLLMANVAAESHRHPEACQPRQTESADRS